MDYPQPNYPQQEYIEQPQYADEQPQQRYGLPPGGYPNINPPVKETTVISQTNPKYVIEEIKQLLRGKEETIDENGKTIWIKNEFAKPLINEIGLSGLFVNLHNAGQDKVFSNFEEEPMLGLVRNNGYILIDRLGENMDEWRIEQGDLSTILYTILDTINAAYRRGMNQGERIFVKTFYTENNTQVTRPIEMPQQRKKFLGIF